MTDGLWMSRWIPVALVLGAMLAGCGGTTGHARTGRRFQDLDSASQSCLKTPGLCNPPAGEEAVVPLVGAARAAASVGTAGSAVLQFLREPERQAIEEALARCADDARSTVLLDRFDGKSPTDAECLEEVERDSKGGSVTRAMKWGLEMHQVALECARQALQRLRPGGYSLEPCYRYDPGARSWVTLSPDSVQCLRAEGRYSELRGTLVPDVVIHKGTSEQPLRIYDFKFPCRNGATPQWRPYPKGHIYAGQPQNKVYQRAFSCDVSSVSPRFGVQP